MKMELIEPIKYDSVIKKPFTDEERRGYAVRANMNGIWQFWIFFIAPLPESVK